jgi:hypothetical protein
MDTEDSTSIFRRGEKTWDDFIHLWKHRPWVCLLILLFFLTPLAWLGIEKFVTESAAQQELQRLKNENTEIKRDRDSKANQLAPFLAIANQQFKSVAPDQRLDLLVDMVRDVQKTLKRLPTVEQRMIQEDAVASAIQLFRQLPPMEVQLAFCIGDSEASVLTDQFEKLFSKSGWHVKPTRHYASITPTRGVIVSIAVTPNESIARALSEIGRGLGQNLILYIDPNTNSNELSIMISGK